MEPVLRREANAAVESQAVRQPAHQRRRRRALRVAEVAELPAVPPRHGTFGAAADRWSTVRWRPSNPGGSACRRWVAVDSAAVPWRRYAPVIAVTLAALLALGSLTRGGCSACGAGAPGGAANS
jgi:hypothetical protein